MAHVSGYYFCVLQVILMQVMKVSLTVNPLMASRRLLIC